MSALGLLTRFGQSAKASGGGPPSYLITSLPAASSNVGADHIGWIFNLTPSITVKGLRIYAQTGGLNETLSLWTAGGTLLDSVMVTTVAGAWVEGLFASPIALPGSSQYKVSTYSGGSRAYWHPPASGTTFAASIEYVAGVYGTGPGNPTSPWLGRVLGIVDAIVQ